MTEVKVDIENQNENKENENENVWKVGCLGSLDRRCIVYFSQLITLSICIGVSLYQVSTKEQNKDFWISLLSSSIGIMIPSPKMSK